MMFDRLVIDDVNRTADVWQYASGKSINAARVLQTLGKSPLATGFAGRDSGAFLLADLNRETIANDFVTVAVPTRMCITLVDRSASTATELIEESRAVPVQAYVELLEKFRRHLPRALGVVLSGSLPPSAPVDFYADCVIAANAAGKFVVLDASGEPLRRALRHRPTVVKPNRRELSQTVNLPVETDAELKIAIAKLLTDGPRWAVITDGAKQTVASDGRQFWKIATPKVKVVSAVGSGDSFAAGLAAGLSAGQEVPQACKLAAACGAANAMSAMAGCVAADVVNLLTESAAVSEF
jgi:tagatose 6-phosphate kinase